MPVRLLACALTAATLLASRTTTAQQPARAALVHTIDSIAAAPAKSGAVAGMAVAVIRGHDTLLMKGYGFSDLENRVPVTPQSVFRIGSVTKQFTSSAVMQLVEQGKLHLDDDIKTYLPQVQTHGRKIVLRELLNHTSGIPSYTDVDGAFGKVMREDLPHDSLIALVAHDSLQFEPGSHFYYNNTGYFILGMLIEKITGKPYGEYLNEKLFTPNKLAATTYCDTRRIIPHRAQGYQRGRNGLENSDFLSMDLPYAAGSLCSTVGDLVRWTQLLNNGGIVSAASFHEMTTPVNLTSGRHMPYGFGLMPDTLGGHRTIAHGGGINGFISHVMYVPDDSLAIAVLSNTAPAPSQQVAEAIARVVLGLPAARPTPPKDLAIPADERAKLAGDYELTGPDGTKHVVKVLDENGGLTIVVERKRSKMQYQGGNAFVVPGQGRIDFDVDGAHATGFQMNGTSVRPLEGARRN
jgi:CubicO group peptidase (beta-lactamase class C family)